MLIATYPSHFLCWPGSDFVARTKYNVDLDLEKRTYEGIVFASQLEMKYYRDVVLPLSRSGDITYFELQKKYVLQPKFNNGSKNVKEINYIADFYIEYSDGRKEVVDTKGCADSAAKLKRKMFWYVYPDIPYKWVTYVKKHGGWIDYDECARLRRLAKKARLEEKGEENE